MLKDKVVLITGSTRGIGRAIAEVFAKNRATLILNARHEDSTKELANSLHKRYGIQAYSLAFDVSQQEEVKKAFSKLLMISKTLDVVVNNAGILNSALIGMASKNNILTTYETNVFSAYYISSYSSRIMSRKKSGSIINLTSIMGVEGEKAQSVYAGSKAALIGITKSLSKELATNNIRVNAIAPGFIDTDMTKELTQEQYEQRVNSIAMKRVGTAEDVANVALFLASEMSVYVTGEVIGVDGGMVL